MIAHFQGVFMYIQELWGFIAPGILASFVIGLLNKRTPPAAAKGALLLGVALYGFSRFGKFLFALPGLNQLTPMRSWIALFNSWSLLHHMAIVFIIVVAYMLWMTRKKSLTAPVEWPNRKSEHRSGTQSLLDGRRSDRPDGVAVYLLLVNLDRTLQPNVP
ncbi:MAG TPA: hypothetical protein PK843_05925 [bacterium]|nr:hypothetical protein [bacterium]HPN34029.1 hypothetical protein [bacterium]